MQEAGEAGLPRAGVTENNGEALLRLDHELGLAEGGGVDRREEQVTRGGNGAEGLFFEVEVGQIRYLHVLQRGERPCPADSNPRCSQIIA